MAVDERLQPSMSEPAAKRHRLCQAECSSPPPHLLDSHTTDAAQAAEAQTAAPAAHVIDLTEAPDHSALGTYRPAGLNPARPAVLPINTIINVQVVFLLMLAAAACIPMCFELYSMSAAVSPS